jgi:uncharacterized YigZ family protein
MLFSDTYNEITQNAEASLRERGSKFLAYSYIVYNESEVKKHLNELKSKYPDATHHCYAYVIGQGSEAQRANDDGEPSNSAGRPILRAILSKQLTNVLVVVVRYFGGTLLGIPGLIESYGASATMVLNESEKVEKMMEEQFLMTTDFQHEQEIHRILNQFQVRILKREYTEKVIYTIAIRKNQVMQFEKMTGDSYLVNLQINK